MEELINEMHENIELIEHELAKMAEILDRLDDIELAEELEDQILAIKELL
ncbi:hypothetical protein [Campylobacter blaseri]|nr:hypothetical protein [Campylobacter blaseri]